MATDVTRDQAKGIAKAKELNGFFLAPKHPEPWRKADLLTYKRHEDGDY